jgi:hypothetical protein
MRQLQGKISKETFQGQHSSSEIHPAYSEQDLEIGIVECLLEYLQAHARYEYIM